MLNPQACSDAPRWRINGDGVLTMEHTVPADVVEELRRMGHQPEVAAADSLDFGGARLIRRLDGAAVACEAGSDHRTDGQAVGS